MLRKIMNAENAFLKSETDRTHFNKSCVGTMNFIV